VDTDPQPRQLTFSPRTRSQSRINARLPAVCQHRNSRINPPLGRERLQISDLEGERAAVQPDMRQLAALHPLPDPAFRPTKPRRGLLREVDEPPRLTACAGRLLKRSCDERRKPGDELFKNAGKEHVQRAAYRRPARGAGWLPDVAKTGDRAARFT